MKLTEKKIRDIAGSTRGGRSFFGGGGSGGGGRVNYADNAGHADSADLATEAEKLTSDSTDWQKILRKDITDTAAEIITFAKGIVSTLVSKFKAGIKIGASDQFEIDASGNATLHDINAGGDVDVDGDATVDGDLFLGGHLSGTTAAFTDITANNIGNQNNRVTQIYATGINAINTVTENLNVTKEAHFTKLVVDELLSNKGALITSCANCVAEVVVDNDTYFDVYFSAVDRDGNAVSNPWLMADQALCLTFDGLSAGTFANVKNRYYWRVVTRVDSNITYNGKTYHHIRLANTSGMYDGSTTPAAGDNIVQLGYRGTVSGNEYRKSATILSSYPTMDAGVTPPSLAFYKGINDFSLSTHRYTFIDGLSNEFIGNFKILVNGSYTNLTTVLATVDGLVSTVTKTVRGKNLIPTEGWSNVYGDLLPVANFEPTEQMLDNGNDDVIYSPVIYLPAGTYCFSCYCALTSLELYVYASSSPEVRADFMTVIDDVFLDQTVDGDRYTPAGSSTSLSRRYGTFTLANDSYVILNIYEDTTQFEAYHPQLEAGSTPTTYELGVVTKSSQIKQTADQINLSIRTALGQTGININGSMREINLIAGKVNFKTSGGQTNPNISIDPTTGTLSAVNGNFSGIVNAATLYRSFMRINIYSGMPGMNGSTLTLATYLADSTVNKPLPDVFFLYSSTVTATVKLPAASQNQGKMIEVVGMYDWSGFRQITVYAEDANMCSISGAGTDIGLRFNASNSSYYGTGFARLLSAQDNSTWKWHILEWDKISLLNT